MIVLVGPSASGKSEVASMLIKKYNMKRVVTCTTRNMRLGEIDGVHYHFLSKEEFLKKIDNDEFLEVTLYNNNYYGTLKNEISMDKIIILDVNGLNTLVEKSPNDITIFFINTPYDTRLVRMLVRGDSEEIIQQRSIYDKEAFKKEKIKRIDYEINNYNSTIEETADKIYNLYLKS